LLYKLINSRYRDREYLTEKEILICQNLIQWLVIPVGQGLLRGCGFEQVKIN